jgi:hypothetical protein
MSGLKFGLLGAAACAAVYALSFGAPTASTNLYTPIDAVELEFVNFVAHHRKNYGTKEEYAFRLEAFRATKAKLAAFEA